jgi:PIN domain nuclease of toxin-antitoxin system
MMNQSVPFVRYVHGLLLTWLPVQWTHIRRLDQLPTPHKGPFDRLLIAQAIEEQLTLVSVDPMMALFPVAVLG